MAISCLNANLDKQLDSSFLLNPAQKSLI